MKQLKDFICESFDSFYIHDVFVTYDCPKDLYLEVPDGYTEDNVLMYLNDTLLNSLPGGDDKAEKFFGKNEKNIIDMYFEYDKCIEIENKKPDIEFDSHYNNDSNTEENDNLIVYHIENLKYILKFDKFNVLEDERENVEESLFDIFNRTVSNEINEYPIELTLDSKNIEYRK